MSRVIRAKFESQCTRCKGRIFEGDRINWEKGVKGVSHVNCGEAQPEPENHEFVDEPKADASKVVGVGFDLHRMTPEQLKALRDIIDSELTIREAA